MVRLENITLNLNSLPGRDRSHGVPGTTPVVVDGRGNAINDFQFGAVFARLTTGRAEPGGA